MIVKVVLSYRQWKGFWSSYQTGVQFVLDGDLNAASLR